MRRRRCAVQTAQTEIEAMDAGIEMDAAVWAARLKGVQALVKGPRSPDAARLVIGHREGGKVRPSGRVLPAGIVAEGILRRHVLRILNRPGTDRRARASRDGRDGQRQHKSSSSAG